MGVWRGYGIVVCAFIALGYIAARIGAEMMWGNPLPRDHRPATELAGMLLSSMLIYCLHRAIDQCQDIPAPGNVTPNETDGPTVHSLLYVPIRFWPYITAAIGIVLFFR